MGRAGMLAMLVVAGCKDADDAAPQPARPLAGERITVAGEIERVLDPRSFVLETAMSVWTHPIRIVGDRPIAFAGEPPHEDDLVIVTGVVGDSGAESAIHAETIRRVQSDARWSADPAKSSVAVLAILNAADSVSLVGQPVKYETARIQRVDERTLWVGPNAKRAVLVVPAGAKQLDNLRRGDRIEIEGTIRQMPDPARARADLGIAPTIPDVTLEGEHVYIHATKLERLRTR